MTTIRSLGFRHRMAIVAILAIVAIGATAFVVGDMRAGAVDFKTADFQAGQLTPSTSDESDSEILIAKVGEESLSLAQLKEEKLHVAHMKLLSERELAGLGTEAELPSKYLEARLGVVIKWGPETAALASLIQNLALLEEARALEVSATEEEVAENTALSRAAYDNGNYDPYNKGYIASIGEDTYWADVYPGKAEILLSIDNLHNHVAEEGEAVVYRKVKTLWVSFIEAVLAKTVIELPDSVHHSTTLEDVLGFLSDVRDVDRESLLIPAEHLAEAPAETWVVYVMLADGTVETTESDEAAVECSDEDTDGNVTRWICDEATGETEIASLEDSVMYMIVEPGNPLPVFDE